jgi:predicted transglutaminase-like cysteine proteinase
MLIAPPHHRDVLNGRHPMTKGLMRRTGLAFLAFATLVSGVHPSFSRESRPPLGLQLYCLQNKGACEKTAATQVDASGDVVNLLRAVNRHYNSAIQPRSDRGGDIWSADATSGDCEDYVLAKRQHLIASGIPAGAMRIAYTTTRSGEGHAILLVQTSSGSLVLDNLASEVRSLEASGYQVHRMSSGGLLTWVSNN